MRPLSPVAWRLPALMILMVALLVILNWPWRINNDVAMYLTMGDRFAQGEVLYVDLIDVNPPLVSYLSSMTANAARLLGTYLPVTFLVGVWLFSLWSVTATFRIVRDDVAHPSRAGVLAGAMAAFSVWVLWLTEFGQREHLFVLGFVPYFLLRCRRQSAAVVSPVQALLIGLAAGVVASLKPHFLIMALAPELYWAARRKGRPVISLELVALMTAVALYAGHFLLLPEAMRTAWFERWVPMIVSSYHVYKQPLPLVLADWTLWLPGVAGLLLLALTWRRSIWSGFGPALGTAMAVAVVNVFVQQKGWHYQAIPAEAMLFLAGGLALSAVVDRLPSTTHAGGAMRAASRIAVPAAVTILAVQLVAAGALAIRPRSAQAVDVIAPVNPLVHPITSYTSAGDPVLILSTGVSPTFPLLTQLDRRPGTRYMFAFPLPMLYAGISGSPFPYRLLDARHAAEEVRFREELRADIRNRQPALILVTDRCQACPEGFTLRGYLEAWGFVASAMSDYRELAPLDGTQVYVRHGN